MWYIETTTTASLEPVSIFAWRDSEPTDSPRRSYRPAVAGERMLAQFGPEQYENILVVDPACFEGGLTVEEGEG